jgi:hypothetical protein
MGRHATVRSSPADGQTQCRSEKGPAMSNRKSYGQKWVKPLLKLILDFGLAKGKSAVEFRERS